MSKIVGEASVIGNYVYPEVWTNEINTRTFDLVRSFYLSGYHNTSLEDSNKGSSYKIPYTTNNTQMNFNVNFNDLNRSVGSIHKKALTCSVDYAELSTQINLADAVAAGYDSYFDDVIQGFSNKYAQGLEKMIASELSNDKSINVIEVPTKGQFDFTFLSTSKISTFGSRSQVARTLICSPKQYLELMSSQQIVNVSSGIQSDVVQSGSFQGKVAGIDVYMSEHCEQADGSHVAFLMTQGLNNDPFILSTKQSNAIQVHEDIRTNTTTIYFRPMLGFKSLNNVFEGSNGKPESRIVKLVSKYK